MIGEDDRNRGRDNDDTQGYREERQRGTRGRSGGKAYPEDDPPPPPKGYGKATPRPPQYDAGGEPPPPPPKGYGKGAPRPPSRPDYGAGDETPPPPPKGYGKGTPRPPSRPEYDSGEPPPPPKGYGKEPPPPEETYDEEETPPPGGYGDEEETPPVADGYGDEEEIPPVDGYGEDETEPPGEGYGDDEEDSPPGEGYGDDEEEPTPPQGGYGDDATPPCGEDYDDGSGEPPPEPYQYEKACIPVDPLYDDDPEPRGTLLGLKGAKARAETGKDIEPILEIIALCDADYLAKRKALEAAYAAATGPGDAPDNLRRRYREADIAFREAVNYMLRKAPGERRNLLQYWLYCNMCAKDAPVRRVLSERRQVRMRLRDCKGPRELALQDAHEKTERWAAAWKAWSDPVKNIDAIIKSYESRIGTLMDLFNDKPTADKAILEFWFEVAPLHLGLRSEPVDEGDEPGVRLMREALGEFEDVQAWLSSAVQRGQGGLYLIDAADLRRERARVLRRWDEAAGAEASAKAAYELRPDSAAKLGERYDGLKDDKWFARVKTALSPPAAAK